MIFFKLYNISQEFEAHVTPWCVVTGPMREEKMGNNAEGHQRPVVFLIHVSSYCDTNLVLDLQKTVRMHTVQWRGSLLAAARDCALV